MSGKLATAADVSVSLDDQAFVSTNQDDNEKCDPARLDWTSQPLS
jgi:hypothetical protein